MNVGVCGDVGGRFWSSFSRNKGGGVIVVDHVAVGGGVRAGGGGAPLGLDLQPGLSKRLSEVVVHRSRDGHRVGHRLRLLVVLPQAAAEVLLDHGVTSCVCCKKKNLIKFTHSYQRASLITETETV